MKALPAIATCLAIAIAGCGGGGSAGGSPAAADSAEPPALTGKPTVTVPEGPPPTRLVVEDLQEGNGAPVERGDYLTVQYVGVGYESGEEFGSSWGGKPLHFTVGAGEVMPGWEKGIEGMRSGGRRELIVPPSLADGKPGPSGASSDETLVFAIDLFEDSTPPSNSR